MNKKRSTIIDIESLSVFRRRPNRTLNKQDLSMWYRIVRLLKTGGNAYIFYSNPFRYFLAFLLALLIPYAVYIFWGSVIVFILAALGIYFLFKLIKSAIGKAPYT